MDADALRQIWTMSGRRTSAAAHHGCELSPTGHTEIG
jgi:hypothetical protein